MEFICIKQCFRDDNLYDIGMSIESDIDISKPEKKGAKPCWMKKGKKADDAISDAKEIERVPVRKLHKMEIPELVLYVFERFKGTKLDAHSSKTAMIKEIAILEKAKERENKIGMV